MRKDTELRTDFVEEFCIICVQAQISKDLGLCKQWQVVQGLVIKNVWFQKILCMSRVVYSF